MHLDTNRSLLGDLHLAPPPTGPRSTSDREVPASEVRRAHGPAIPLRCPLFAYDLPWALLPPTTCALLARELTESAVVTSLLDLDVDEDRPADLVMCPYRPERYGVTIDDLSRAAFVDLRLNSEVGDGSVYTMDQLRRWDHRADSLPDSTVITGSRWPADVASPDKLGRKIEQLRALAPQAAIFVAISPFHLQQDLPNLLAARPDGIVLRFDLDPTSPSVGNLIAAQTAACRRMIDASEAAGIALWVSAPTTSPLDLVKLLALGASAVSIDYLVLHNWPAADPAPAAGAPHASYAHASALGHPSAGTATATRMISPIIDTLLNEALTYVHGLGVAHYSQLRPHMLACIDPTLAKRTGAMLVE
ncbi:hypothetical protein EC9_17120 [Rosistilla ulvae]|uniref:Uncharacterized protein n=1 Tax=Rosistilla ulvae TaxID=1930277 RepID=A0A517LY48_9BACT|nr:hypothetical protein [Rosistilla ulvae]QDS87533.1 hypothetical protein EC9_17120 [Rosistilla ulvae]